MTEASELTERVDSFELDAASFGNTVLNFASAPGKRRLLQDGGTLRSHDLVFYRLDDLTEVARINMTDPFILPEDVRNYYSKEQLVLERDLQDSSYPQGYGRELTYRIYDHRYQSEDLTHWTWSEPFCLPEAKIMIQVLPNGTSPSADYAASTRSAATAVDAKIEFFIYK